jgi:hypothetical protein
MIGNFRERNGHKISGISGIDSNYSIIACLTENYEPVVLDARTSKDTYMERSIAEIERNSVFGSAAIGLGD